MVRLMEQGLGKRVICGGGGGGGGGGEDALVG